MIQKNAFYYGLRALGDTFNEYVERFKTSESHTYNLFLNKFRAEHHSALINLYRSLNLTHSNWQEILKYIYNFSVQDKAIVSEADFSTIFSLLFEDQKSNELIKPTDNNKKLEKVYNKVFERIRDHYPLPYSLLERHVDTRSPEEKEKEEIKEVVEFFEFYLETYDYTFLYKVISKLPVDKVAMLEEIAYQQIYSENISN